MVKRKTVTKSKFSQINDKRFYFTDAIVSLPFGHPNLNEIEDFKQKLATNWKILVERKGVPFQFRKKGIKNPSKALFVPSNFNVYPKTV